MRNYPVTPEMEKRLANEAVYHAPKDDQPERYQELRAAFTALKRLVIELTPPSREQSLVLTHLQEANMLANQSIALNE